MLPSPLEMPNPAEDQAVRMVAPASEVDDAIPPAKVLPGCLGPSVLCALEQSKIAPISSSSVNSHRWHGGQHL